MRFGKLAMLSVIAVGSAWAALAQSATPQVTYIHAGRLLDRPGQAPRGASTIIVRDGTIAEIRDGFVEPEAGARVVELRDRFVMPGMIDMHVHMFTSGDPLKARLELTTRDREDDLMIATGNARADLLAGFTTVRDLGGPPRGVRALRDAIARGDVPGPTIVNAGEMISVSGGHGDLGGLNQESYEAFHPRDYNNVCNGPDDCRRATREQIRLGAQVIKFAATGGVLSNVAGGLGQQMTGEEMSAIVQTAHAFGRKAAAHSHAKEGTAAAVAAGVDTIDHGTFLDEPTARAMVQHGTWLVPTMLASATAVQQARSGVLPAATLPKAEQAVAAARASHVLAIRLGVKIAFGTDTGVSKHGDNAKEFALMIDRGMSPMAAIVAATTGAAEALGQGGRLGLIAPGLPADIIAVAGDPLTDVTRLEKVSFVMKLGQIFKQEQ